MDVIIEIDWTHFITFDEIFVDDMQPFSIILLTLVKDDTVQLVAYDKEEKQWAVLH